MDPPPSRGSTRDGFKRPASESEPGVFFCGRVMKSDDENLLFADDLGKVDALNAKFNSRGIHVAAGISTRLS